MAGKIIFVTGTDTGVGKTVFTALFLHHLRASGVHALAMKPFCSGGRSDAQVLHSLMENELSLEEVNPYFFSAPLAPLIAARQEGRRVALDDVRSKIAALAARCECLLVEGAGGLLAPLGENLALLDLVEACRGKVVLVAPNKLGTINHILLNFQALQGRHRQTTSRVARLFAVVLMAQERPDPSAFSNPAFLRDWGRDFRVSEVPFLGSNPLAPRQLKKFGKKFQKTLAEL